MPNISILWNCIKTVEKTDLEELTSSAAVDAE